MKTYAMLRATWREMERMGTTKIAPNPFTVGLGDLVDDFEELEADRDALRAELDQAKAQSGAMRGLLNEALAWLEWPELTGALSLAAIHGFAVSPERSAQGADLWKRIRSAALSGDAGRDLLERVRKLEAVADAARDVAALCPMTAEAKKLTAALVALDGGE